MKNYDNKFSNLDEMDNFTARHKLPELTQGEIENLNTPTAIWRKEKKHACAFSRNFYCYL